MGAVITVTEVFVVLVQIISRVSALAVTIKTTEIFFYLWLTVVQWCQAAHWGSFSYHFSIIVSLHCWIQLGILLYTEKVADNLVPDSSTDLLTPSIPVRSFGSSKQELLVLLLTGNTWGLFAVSDHSRWKSPSGTQISKLRGFVLLCVLPLYTHCCAVCCF